MVSLCALLLARGRLLDQDHTFQSLCLLVNPALEDGVPKKARARGKEAVGFK